MAEKITKIPTKAAKNLINQRIEATTKAREDYLARARDNRKLFISNMMGIYDGIAPEQMMRELETEATRTVAALMATSDDESIILKSAQELRKGVASRVAVTSESFEEMLLKRRKPLINKGK